MGWLKTRVAFSSKKKQNVLSKNQAQTSANQHLLDKDGKSRQSNITLGKEGGSIDRLSPPPQLSQVDYDVNVLEDYSKVHLRPNDIGFSRDTEHMSGRHFSPVSATEGEFSNAVLSAHNSKAQDYKGSSYPRIFSDEPSNDDKEGSMSEPEKLLAKLPVDIWSIICDFLDPLSAANLAHSCKILRYRLGARPWSALDAPENIKDKTSFLTAMDEHLPRHVFCFLCAVYHTRLNAGKERLQADHVANPVFDCPNAQKLFLPRARLTHRRELPFAYVQLATRAERFSSKHGIPVAALRKNWKCRDSTWSHDTAFHFAENRHLWMRVRSTTFAKANLQPNEQRLLLYSRSDYAPYFSVCAHWSNGNLMHLCKCALSHVPAPAIGVVDQWRKGPKLDFKAMKTNMFPRQCDQCKMLRRCTECPTEYLIRIKLVEDPKDRGNQFKHALTVTRWSDLGDGSSPTQSVEWASCNGQQYYDSLKAVTNASLCSLFESAVSGIAPGDRVAPLETFRYGATADVY